MLPHTDNPINRSSQVHPVGQPPNLPGGFAVGDAVLALLSHSSRFGTICPLDAGVVTGPDIDDLAGSSASGETPTMVRVSFANYRDPHGLGLSLPACRIFPAEANAPRLPQRIKVGDRVVAMVFHTDEVCGTVEPGDVGVVNGPRKSWKPGEPAWKDDRISVKWPRYSRSVHHW